MLFSTAALGQNHSVGLQGGLNFTNINSKESFENTKIRTGFTGGITYDLKLKGKYRIEVDLLYAQQGFTDKVIFVEDENVYIGEEN